MNLRRISAAHSRPTGAAFRDGTKVLEIGALQSSCVESLCRAVLKLAEEARGGPSSEFLCRRMPNLTLEPRPCPSKLPDIELCSPTLFCIALALRCPLSKTLNENRTSPGSSFPRFLGCGFYLEPWVLGPARMSQNGAEFHAGPWASRF